MKAAFRPIVAIVLGLVVGSAVNMALVMLSSSVVPLPEGVDPTDMESLKAGMALFGPEHFVMPWLAHALGTLVGAFIAAKIVARHKKKFALVIGAFFLLGGIVNVYMLPSPLWFNIVDLVFAYIPIALLGHKLATR